MRTVVASAVLAVVVGLPGRPAGAQTPSQQAGRPQPAPAPKVAPPQNAAPKAPEAQASTPKAASPQPAGAKPEAQKPAPKAAAPQAPGPKPSGPAKPVLKKPLPPRTSKVWKGRGFVVVTGGAQLIAPKYTSSTTFFLHAEDATLNATSKAAVGPAFGVRGGMRVWKNMAVGVDVGMAKTSRSVDVTGRLPHPFLFNQFREVKGTAEGLSRVESLAAIEASWFFALKRRVDMFVFAGPAYFSVRQDMATRIQFTEVYPYDTASFTGVESTRVSGGAVGMTAGADVAYLLTKRAGVGGQLRYSFASPALKVGGQSTTVRAGGLQLSVGGRILF